MNLYQKSAWFAAIISIILILKGLVTSIFNTDLSILTIVVANILPIMLLYTSICLMKAKERKGSATTVAVIISITSLLWLISLIPGIPTVVVVIMLVVNFLLTNIALLFINWYLARVTGLIITLVILFLLAIFLAGSKSDVLSSLNSKDSTNTGPAGIIYGPNYSYSLAAPEGWLLDNQTGKQQGLLAVFYKEGDNLQTSDVVMYSNTISKSATKPDLSAVIDYDLKGFKNAYPDLEISDAPDLATMDISGAKAKVKYEFNEPMTRYQAVAYIDTPNTVVLIVLDAKNKIAFDSNVASFEKLVNSYFYVTSKVEIRK